ncbi:biotin--[acetyl-CoA-carboxylase] ligase [Eggerthella sinensis]|uniref:biotin--[acetyl-CoA-carboxylase] ligase n=1 Tax=Eggerthella sinensis TaxID=242230 RepID=UPI0022E956AD|nr:biotin--[acetyl-CoA-carboxylase] ligase [Eggerthella sinensis]
MLEENRERYVSGAKLAQAIGVSRNAVWKGVEALRAEGYAIDAVTNKGYALSQENDLLSPQGIERFLPQEHPFGIVVRKRVDSTNAEARRRALEGAPEGTVIVAEEQTAGKGRPGKSFFSPSATGLYLSIVLRPSLAADRAQFITCAAAVAGAQAIEQVTGKTALIKWVNDIYCDERKVAGILTEGVVDMESGRFEHAVAGHRGEREAGRPTGFPSEIADVAGAVLDDRTGAVRCELAAAILTRFWDRYRHMDDAPFTTSIARPLLFAGAAARGAAGLLARASARRRPHRRLQTGHRAAGQNASRAALRRSEHGPRVAPPRRPRAAERMFHVKHSFSFPCIP